MSRLSLIKMQLAELFKQLISALIPVSPKVAVFFAFNLVALVVALSGYFNHEIVFKLLGVAYTFVCGFSIFAGLNYYERDCIVNKR